MLSIEAFAATLSPGEPHLDVFWELNVAVKIEICGKKSKHPMPNCYKSGMETSQNKYASRKWRNLTKMRLTDFYIPSF